MARKGFVNSGESKTVLRCEWAEGRGRRYMFIGGLGMERESEICLIYYVQIHDFLSYFKT